MIDNFFENLSKACLAYMNETGTDITKLARKCDISRPELTSIINCTKQDIKMSTVAKICESTNTPPHCLLCLGECPLVEFMTKFPKDFRKYCLMQNNARF